MSFRSNRQNLISAYVVSDGLIFLLFIILTLVDLFVAVLHLFVAGVFTRCRTILFFTGFLVFSLSKHFLLKSTLFPVDLQNIFCAGEIDIMSKTDIFKRIFHHCDFVDECPPFFIVYFTIFYAKAWFSYCLWFHGETVAVLLLYYKIINELFNYFCSKGVMLKDLSWKLNLYF